MKDDLAEWLLATVMGWEEEDVTRERSDLQALASLKYDEYQQFSPGMRFVESLAIWLSQFEPSERKIAYEFIKKRLIFISSAEMAHFVTMAFPDIIYPQIISEVGSMIGEPDSKVVKISTSMEYKELLRQSLFLGLSDGAHIDIFRRTNLCISQEQVWISYELSKNKVDELLRKLNESLKSIGGPLTYRTDNKFKMLFLLDDFSGSGTSYFRKEGVPPTYHGKIVKILHQIFSLSQDSALGALFNIDDVKVCIVLYVATTQALQAIQEAISDFCKSHKIPESRCHAEAVFTLPESIKVSDETDKEMIKILQKYFDNDIIDEHYKKGRHDKPFLGFDECSLPLILSHNSPNNTIPLLWFDENKKYRGLFPRVSRHRREQ